MLTLIHDKTKETYKWMRRANMDLVYKKYDEIISVEGGYSDVSVRRIVIKTDTSKPGILISPRSSASSKR